MFKSKCKCSFLKDFWILIKFSTRSTNIGSIFASRLEITRPEFQYSRYNVEQRPQADVLLRRLRYVEGARERWLDFTDQHGMVISCGARWRGTGSQTGQKDPRQGRTILVPRAFVALLWIIRIILVSQKSWVSGISMLAVNNIDGELNIKF